MRETMSLRDQLLKAGVVTADQVRKAEAEKNRQSRKLRKGPPSAAERDRAQEQRQRLEEQAQRKRERDRELNLQREAERERKERAQRALQLLASHRLNDPDADIRYSFMDPNGRFIRSIWVTAKQQEDLAEGRLAIARGNRKSGYVLVSAETAGKLREISPERLVLLYTPGDGEEAAEQP
jgi:uncharacterized protein